MPKPRKRRTRRKKKNMTPELNVFIERVMGGVTNPNPVPPSVDVQSLGASNSSSRSDITEMFSDESMESISPFDIEVNEVTAGIEELNFVENFVEYPSADSVLMVEEKAASEDAEYAMFQCKDSHEVRAVMDIDIDTVTGEILQNDIKKLRAWHRPELQDCPANEGRQKELICGTYIYLAHSMALWSVMTTCTHSGDCPCCFTFRTFMPIFKNFILSMDPSLFKQRTSALYIHNLMNHFTANPEIRTAMNKFYVVCLEILMNHDSQQYQKQKFYCQKGMASSAIDLLYLSQTSDNTVGPEPIANTNLRFNPPKEEHSFTPRRFRPCEERTTKSCFKCIVSVPVAEGKFNLVNLDRNRTVSLDLSEIKNPMDQSFVLSYCEYMLNFVHACSKRFAVLGESHYRETCLLIISRLASSRQVAVDEFFKDIRYPFTNLKLQFPSKNNPRPNYTTTGKRKKGARRCAF